MFYRLPIITRYWFGASLVLTLSSTFGILNHSQIVWNWHAFRSDLELWRILTAFCYGGPCSLGLLFLLYMQVSFSQQYEEGIPFNTGAGGGTADYAFCLLLGAIGILGTYPLLTGWGVYLQSMFLSNLSYYVLYVWSKKHPNAQAKLWGFPMKGIHLPFAYLAIRVLIGHPYQDMCHGMFLGHLYYFAADVAPLVYGKNFVHTPVFLIDYFGVGEYRPETPAPNVRRPRNNFGGFGNSAADTATAPDNAAAGAGANRRTTGGHDWGSGGNRLGTN
jgi:hypothetical protein